MNTRMMCPHTWTLNFNAKRLKRRRAVSPLKINTLGTGIFSSIFITNHEFKVKSHFLKSSPEDQIMYDLFIV
jgi:hypothetical protein